MEYCDDDREYIRVRPKPLSPSSQERIQMDVVVGNKFLRASGAERGRLKGNCAQFVKNDSFVNIIENIDINDKKGAQISRVCFQLAAFNSNKELWNQVEEWLRS